MGMPMNDDDARTMELCKSMIGLLFHATIVSMMTH